MFLELPTHFISVTYITALAPVPDNETDMPVLQVAGKSGNAVESPLAARTNNLFMVVALIVEVAEFQILSEAPPVVKNGAVITPPSK